ncbi:hypothetical protein [Mesobacterium pallidum]|uniref:hypothetical protein n=1 Tax=Mesobacterium pallidum TaxID=2872037 RepID=UPI001EE26616|nr:hypothetical protein [Mesobacterium pallidum]
MPRGEPSVVLLISLSAAALGGLVGYAAAAGGWRPVLSGVFLALATFVASLVWTGLGTCRRSSATDTIGWRLARAGILAALRPAMRAVLSARETPGPDGSARLLPHEIDALSVRIEPMAVNLREHAALAEFPSVGNRLMVELAVFTAAAYRVLLDAGWTAEAARSAVADAGWLLYARMLALSSLPFRLTTRDPAKRLRRTIRTLLRFPFGAPGAPGYEVRVSEDASGISTHFTHCPPQTFVRTLILRDDRGDLEAFRQSWCRYDWPGADLIAGDGRRGHYSRPHTLSHGDLVCDMCWTGQPFSETKDRTITDCGATERKSPK